MIYEQQITMTIKYDPEVEEAPEEWDWPLLLDLPDPSYITITTVGPITVVETDG